MELLVDRDAKKTLGESDLSAFWLPFSGNRQFKKDPRIIVGAKGRYYQDQAGRKIFDGLSGLWCSGLGHSIDEINQAVSAQIQELDYSPSFQFAHPKAIELANKIVEFMPSSLNHVFFTGSGSESVETSLKMARAYWQKKGKPQKTRFIGRLKGYHGVNFGGLSVGGIDANRAPCGPFLDCFHLPHTELDGNKFVKGCPDEGAYLAEELIQLIEQHGAESIAAVIIEPMSGSAGVLPPPKGYLKRIRDICSEHELLLIFDEVITAFGRIGSNTAAEKFKVTPDLMCTAKQLTNGAIPMGAVICSDQIYQTFMSQDLPEYLLEFPHGYTYSAHPVACAAGLAALNYTQKNDVIGKVNQISPYFEERLHSLKGAKFVADIRNLGLAGALTIEPKGNEPALRPFQIAMHCWQQGFYVRYAASTIQLGLPFTTTKEEIDDLIKVMHDAIITIN